MEGAMDSGERTSRKQALKALGAAAAGAVAGRVLKGEEAHAAHGALNAVSHTLDPAIHGENSANGPGVEGTSSEGPGIQGRGDVGVSALGGHIAISARGVEHGLIISAFEEGVLSRAAEVAVLGISQTPDGMAAPDGTGVRGRNMQASSFGIGVHGEASGEGVGVKATAGQATATALQVEGRARFSTAAASTIPAGLDSAFVSNSVVTAQSHITVTLTGDPGQASSAPGSKPTVVWVERQPGTGFVVHMSRPVRFAAPFTYLIVEPGA
jgi:hypothetical protein